MNRTALVALPIVAALAGCSASPAETAAPATSSSASSSTSAPASSSPASTPARTARAQIDTYESPLPVGPSETYNPNHWLDQARDQFMASYDRTDVSEFSDGTPHQKITGWFWPAVGHIQVEVENQYWAEARLRWLALEVMDRVHPDGASVTEVSVATEDHDLVLTVHPGDR